MKTPIVFISLIAVVACSSSSGPSTANEWCAETAQAICQRDNECGLITDVASCTVSIDAQVGCSTFSCPAGSSYSAVRGGNCLQEMRSLSCALLAAGVSPCQSDPVCQ